MGVRWIKYVGLHDKVAIENLKKI